MTVALLGGARLRRMLSYEIVGVLSFGTRDSEEDWTV